MEKSGGPGAGLPGPHPGRHWPGMGPQRRCWPITAAVFSSLKRGLIALFPHEWYGWERNVGSLRGQFKLSWFLCPLHLPAPSFWGLWTCARLVDCPPLPLTSLHPHGRHQSQRTRWESSHAFDRFQPDCCPHHTRPQAFPRAQVTHLFFFLNFFVSSNETQFHVKEISGSLINFCSCWVLLLQSKQNKKATRKLAFGGEILFEITHNKVSSTLFFYVELSTRFVA